MEQLEAKIQARYKESWKNVDRKLEDNPDKDRIVSHLKNLRRAPTPYIYNGEMIGHPFNLEDVLNFFGEDAIPETQGIYHLFYKDMLVYIGMTKRIRGRLIQHLRDEGKVFHNVLWFEMEDKTIEQILETEYNMIKKFKPSLNLTHANVR